MYSCFVCGLLVLLSLPLISHTVLGFSMPVTTSAVVLRGFRTQVGQTCSTGTFYLLYHLPGPYQFLSEDNAFFFFFRDKVSLYSPGCPGAHFVDQAGLELRNPPASASRVLGLKACATTPGFCPISVLHICSVLFQTLSMLFRPLSHLLSSCLGLWSSWERMNGPLYPAYHLVIY
jgi:hypothetical protein